MLLNVDCKFLPKLHLESCLNFVWGNYDICKKSIMIFVKDLL